MNEQVKAVIINSSNIKDSDKNLTLLTQDKGVIFVTVKGAQKTKSKFSACSELFSYGTFMLYKNQSGYYLDSGEIENSFYNLTQSIENFTLASYFSQLIYLCFKTKESSKEIFKLFLNCLYFLKEKSISAELIKSIFEMRFITILGYGPLLNGCAKCKQITPGDIFFSTKNSNFKCEKCLQSIEKKDYIKIPDGVFAAVNHFCYCSFNKLFSFNLKKDLLEILNKVTEEYILDKIEINVPTLEFYKAFKN